MSMDIKKLRHDLRTPFNAILNYAEMLLEEEPPRGTAELQTLLSESRSLLQQVSIYLSDETQDLSRTANIIYDSIPRLRHPLQRLVSANLGSDLDKLNAAVDELERLTRERFLEGPPGEPPSRPGAIADLVATPLAEARPFAFARCPSTIVDTSEILIVDDQESNRDLLCRRLERLGHQPVEAPGGLRALELLQARNFDLVLLDLLMPDLNGYEVLARMKADPVMREVPVIIISALDDLQSVVRCIEMGAEDYLPKPFDPVLLRARVSACLEKKHLRNKELAYFQAVRQLESAAAAVETGNYERAALDSVAARDDELGQLARVFQHMASEVKAREERLTQQVHELRISIDQERKSREVAAITGSSIFETLEKKADQLRARRRE